MFTLERHGNYFQPLLFIILEPNNVLWSKLSHAPCLVYVIVLFYIDLGILIRPYLKPK